MANRVFDAWSGGDLSKMLHVLDEPASPLDRHFLLMGIVTEAYKLRQIPEMAALCERIGRLHLKELHSLFPHVSASVKGAPLDVYTFDRLFRVLSLKEDYEGAAEVLELAVKMDIGDYESHLDDMRSYAEQKRNGQ